MDSGSLSGAEGRFMVVMFLDKHLALRPIIVTQSAAKDIKRTAKGFSNIFYLQPILPRTLHLAPPIDRM